MIAHHTDPVLFGMDIPKEQISVIIHQNLSSHPHLVEVELRFTNLPDEENGNEFTLIGGGLDDKGFHGLYSTNFEGKGYHFAIPEHTDGDNPIRDENYKIDYTRTVIQNELSFDIFYEPTQINDWGDRYFEGSEVALNMMRVGTEERVLHASNNEFNWALANIGAGNKAIIEISMSGK